MMTNPFPTRFDRSTWHHISVHFHCHACNQDFTITRHVSGVDGSEWNDEKFQPRYCPFCSAKGESQ